MDLKSEPSTGSPLREIRRSIHPIDAPVVYERSNTAIQPTHHRYQTSDASLCSKSSQSTVSSSILRGDPIDGYFEGAGYKGPIPTICIQPNTSTIFGSERPDTARTDWSHTTSTVSTDTEQIHTASVQVYGNSFGVKGSEPARLIRFASASLRKQMEEGEPVFGSNETLQSAACKMPSSPTSAASTFGDNDERELLSRRKSMQGNTGKSKRRIGGSLSRPGSSHKFNAMKRPSFTSPLFNGVTPPRFGSVRPASADAYRKITFSQSQKPLPPTPTKAV